MNPLILNTVRGLLTPLCLGCMLLALNACGGSDEIPMSATMDGQTYSIGEPVVQALFLGSGDGYIPGAPQSERCAHSIYITANLVAAPSPVAQTVQVTKLAVYRSSGLLLWEGGVSPTGVQMRPDGALSIESPGCSSEVLRGGESVVVVFDVRSGNADARIRSESLPAEEVR